MASFFALVLILACESPSTRAATCETPLDFRTGSVANLPAGEQGETQTCGFFTAATLLDSYARTAERKPAGIPIDPIALAIDLAVDRDRPRWLPFQLTSDPLSGEVGRGGSYFCDIAAYAREAGVCDLGDPRVLDRAWMQKRANQAFALYAILGAFADESENRQREKLEATVTALIPLLRDGDGAPNSETLARAVWENRNRPYRTIRGLLYPACGETGKRRRFDRLPKCRTEWFSRDESLELAIHDRLEAKTALPVPVLLCYQMFREGRAFTGSPIWSSKCILHYTNVIGRRKKNDVCQFLVRNSYDPSGEDAVSRDWERDGADFWVDAETFARASFSVQHLEE